MHFFTTLNGLKKSSLTIIFYGSLTFSLFAQPIPNVLYYEFEDLGNTVTNLAISPPAGANTATIMGAITQGTSGQCGNALIGSGNPASSDYLNTGWVTNLGTGSWTISMYTKDITPSTSLFYIFGDVSANSFRCFTNGVAGANNWILRGTGLTDVYINGGATVAPHISTFVFDNLTNTIYAYLDGVQVSAVPQVSVNIVGTENFKVMGYGSSIGSPAGGKLDNFRLYNYALTASQVLELSNTYIYSSITPYSCGDYTSPSGNSIYTISGIYYDTVVNPIGCDSIYTIDLTILEPTITANTNQTEVCEGNAVILYGSGGNGVYSWNNNVVDSVSFVPSITSSYILNAIDSNGCIGADTIDVIVNPLPLVTANINPSSICQGDTVVFLSTGADSYSWTGGIINGEEVVPSNSGVFTVTGTDFNGCSNTASASLIVNEPTASSINETAVGSFTLNGQTYTESGVYEQVIPNSVGCDSTITLNLTIDDASINELKTSFKVFPNPASQTLTVYADIKIQSLIRITDLQGRLVKTIEMNGVSEVIDLSNLSVGTFILFVGDTEKAIKFLKQ